MATYDLVVLGAGPVGENVADRAVAGGLSAVIVESERVGGECSYWACIPSKVLLRPGAAVRAARSVPGAAAACDHDLDADAILAHRTEMVNGWDDGAQVSWLADAGIDLVRGTARLTGEKEVTVSGRDGQQHLDARQAVAVCTGSRAFLPDLPGLPDAGVWTNREAVGADHVPRSLLIVGGGVVACEMASAYADLGSAVIMLVRDARLLQRTEPVAGELVANALRDRGVEIVSGTSATSLTREAGGGMVHVECDDGQRRSAEEVLMATGRAPRTQDLGLASVGLRDGEWLEVDETMMVCDADGLPASDWLYAVGDVNQRNLITHQGKYQARAAGDIIAARARGEAVEVRPWGHHAATADERAAVQVIFTDPQVGAVGLTQAAAEAAGYRVRVLDQEIGDVAGAALHAVGYQGTARLVIDEEAQVVLGATFVGPDVAEMLHAATIAVVGEVPISRLWHAVPAFPTMSEVWLRLLEDYGRPISP